MTILTLLGYLVGLLFVAVVGLILYFLYRHWQLTTVRKGEVPILPTPIPYLGHALQLGQKPVDFLKSCEEKTSEVFGILAGGQRIFIIHDPLSTPNVLKTNKALSIAEFQDSVLRDLFNTPNEMIHSPLIDWDLIRKFYSTYLLSDKALDGLCGRMMRKFKDIYDQQVTQKLNDSADGRATVKLYDIIGRFIFHVGVGAIFNNTINDDPEKCDKLFDAFMQFDQSVALCLAGVPIKYQGKAFAAFNHIVNTINPLKEDLSDFMQRRCQYFGGIAEKDPNFKDKNGLLNSPLFWASVSNSMPATFWLIYHILKSQKTEYFEVIRKEIQEKIPNWQRFLAANFTKDETILQKDILTMEQLNELYFIDSCFTETLRLVSGSFILRIVVDEIFDLTLNSGNTYRFRKGDRVGLFPCLFHNNPKIFPDPDEFNPYRWMKGDTPEEKLLSAQGRIPLFYEGQEVNP